MAARDWLILIQESDVNKEIKAALEGLLGSFINCTNSKQKTINLLKILDANFTNGFNNSAKVSGAEKIIFILQNTKMSSLDC